MNKYFTVSKVIIKPLILSSAFISIFMTHVSFAQNNADLQLKSVHEQAYEKMSQFDHPNGMDLADLHHVIFSKNKE